MHVDLRWRLDSIYAELDNLVMYAAAWNSMSNNERGDVRFYWEALVYSPVLDIRWRWRIFAAGDPDPEWWQELRAALQEHAALIEYMDLRYPEVGDVIEWRRRDY